MPSAARSKDAPAVCLSACIGLRPSPSAACLACPASFVAVIVVQTMSKEIGSDRRNSDHNDTAAPRFHGGLIHAVTEAVSRAESRPLSSLRNSFRSLGNLALRKDCGAWLTPRSDGDVAVA